MLSTQRRLSTRCVTGSCCRSIARDNDRDELVSTGTKLVISEERRETGNGCPSSFFCALF